MSTLHGKDGLAQMGRGELRKPDDYSDHHRGQDARATRRDDGREGVRRPEDIGEPPKGAPAVQTDA